MNDKPIKVQENGPWAVDDTCGAGLRAPDSTAMPLCRKCHMLLHGGVIEIERQWEWLSQTASLALVEIAEGRLRI